METGIDKATGVYAEQRVVSDLSDCTFYHTMDLPGYGVVGGDWDLRAGVREYLGGVVFGGKRVLELGTADGFLSFHIESQGGDVVSYDLSDAAGLDLVPFARPQASRPDFTSLIQGINNAYWLAHRAYGSRARVVHGDIYSVPAAIGPVDVSVFGAILLHTRDPFGALTPAVQLTRYETVVVTEALGVLRPPQVLQKARRLLPRPLRRPSMSFMPDWRTSEGPEGWWRLSPALIQEFLGILGFERLEVSTHFQRFKGHRRHLYTVVAHRTQPFEGQGGSGRP